MEALYNLTFTHFREQSGAQDRLAGMGFIPHPSIEETVGILAGVGENPKWAFKTEALADSILNFYRDEKNRKGWKLINNSSIMMIFQEGKKKMVIGVSKGWSSNTLIYNLEEDRLANGWTYEPATFYEKNKAARVLQKTDMKSVNPNVPEIRWMPPNSDRLR